MTVAIAATTPATFEIKSANLPLVALLLKSFDLSMLAREMTLRFGDIPDFFDHDALIIDLQQLPAPTAEAPLDFAALMALLRSFRLQPIAVKGGNPAQMAAALAVGLMAAPDAHLLGKPKKSTESTAPAPELAEQQATTATAATPAASANGQLSALIIDKPLRSGQQVYARGRDLVVLAIVNAGAEVIADGHIHVYAPLRGKAMAGARGNPDARIFALALDAELLSIAGVYRTSEQPLPASVKGKPTQVRLVSTPEGDKLMMESMQS